MKYTACMWFFDCILETYVEMNWNRSTHLLLSMTSNSVPNSKKKQFCVRNLLISMKKRRIPNNFFVVMKRKQRILLKLFFQTFFDSKIIIIFGYREKKRNKEKYQPTKEKKRNRSKMYRWSTFRYIRNRDWAYFCEAYYNNSYLCLLWRSRIVISSIQFLG